MNKMNIHIKFENIDKLQLDDVGDFPCDIKFGIQCFSGSDFNNYSKKKIPTFARILRNSDYN